METLRTRYKYISLKSQHTRQWPVAGEEKKSDIPEYDDELEQEEVEIAETQKVKTLLQQTEEDQKARTDALNTKTQLEKLKLKLKLKQKEDSPAKDIEVKLPTKSEQKVTAAEQKSSKKKQADNDRKEKETSEHLAQAFEMLASAELTEENITLITACLVKSDLNIENIHFDNAGRVIVFDVADITIASVYLPSGTGPAARAAREDYCGGVLPRLLTNRRRSGYMIGDWNCVLSAVLLPS